MAIVCGWGRVFLWEKPYAVKWPWWLRAKRTRKLCTFAIWWKVASSSLASCREKLTSSLSLAGRGTKGGNCWCGGSESEADSAREPVGELEPARDWESVSWRASLAARLTRSLTDGRGACPGQEKSLTLAVAALLSWGRIFPACSKNLYLARVGGNLPV